MIHYIIILGLSFLCIILLLIIRQLKHNEGITKDWMWQIRACHDDAIKILEGENWKIKGEQNKAEVERDIYKNQAKKCNEFWAWCREKSPEYCKELESSYDIFITLGGNNVDLL